MSELTFRPLRPSDLPALTAMTSDWEVVRQLGSWPWPPEPEFTAQRCRPYDKDDGFVWAVLHEDNFVGTMGITAGIMGYMIARPHWGRGFATRAGRAAIVRAFRTEVEVLSAVTWADNPASMRVLEKLGFRRGALTEKPSKARGEVVPCYTWELHRAAWTATRRAAAPTKAREGGALP